MASSKGSESMESYSDLEGPFDSETVHGEKSSAFHKKKTSLVK